MHIYRGSLEHSPVTIQTKVSKRFAQAFKAHADSQGQNTSNLMRKILYEYMAGVEE